MAVSFLQIVGSQLSGGVAMRASSESLVFDGAAGRLLEWPLRFQCDGAPVGVPEIAASVSVEGETVCLTIDSSRESFASLTCFVGATIRADQWRTFVLNGHNRTWNGEDDVAVDVMSCNKARGEVNATWFGNVPPRVAAFQMGDGGWLGVSIPGALSVARTTFHFQNGQFCMRFSEYRRCAEVGPLRIYLRLGLSSPLDALDFHAEMTRQAGYWLDRHNHPAWWALPRWGMYDENCHVGQTSLEAPDARNSPLTAERLQQWTKQVRGITGLPEFLVSYDQGYFGRYGEYLPVDSLGGVNGFRILIDQMRDDGVRSGLYFHPFHADVSIPEIVAHPDWLVRGHAPGAPAVSSAMKLASLDWTHPDVPGYVRELVRRIVSSDPGCLNADWLMVNNNHVPDPLQCQFHDRNWGIGDRMAYKARKAIYDFAKQFKPDVLVSFIGCDPVLQETADMFWVNESWGETCDNWHQMAEVVTRCLPGTLVSVNPYILSHGKHAEFASVMPAYSIPSAMPLNHIHAHGHSKQWLPMTQEGLRRWGASWRVYMNAPMTADQTRHVSIDGDHFGAWRKYSRGPLAGFYAALALGRRGVVTYSTTEARITVCDYLIAEVPLPPRAKVQAVEAIDEKGGAQPHPSSIIDRGGDRILRLELSDSGAGQTGHDAPCYYRITYHLIPSDEQ